MTEQIIVNTGPLIALGKMQAFASIARLPIDELKGRRAALAVGLTVIGSLGLIGRAKTLGIISKIKPFIEQARNAGIYYDHNLIEVFLKSLGE
ncbi:MAG: hypothetical protein QOC96_1740 [Acidobacteriota bacterium]|jgi:predicted nucleic acid-binding protein|nr:hypothetical protein [Acidobacteriota bacterium]